jgi:hypothetical protein
LGVTDRESFLKWIDTQSIWFGFIQQLANGTKHFAKQQFETVKVSGYGQGGYGVGPYGRAYLAIDLGEESGEHRWKTAVELLHVVLAFWAAFFRLYRPDWKLPASRHGGDRPAGA